MTPKANYNIKYLIINILQNNLFSSLNKARKDFIISVLWHFLSIKGSNDRILSIDTSYIPKSGKQTYGLGRYWTGSAKAAKWGLDICGFAVVDVENNTAFHLKACQTPGIDKQDAQQFNLLSHYGTLVLDNAKAFKQISDYLVADAYFSKKPFVDNVLKSELHFISRLRDDSVLMYKYSGKPTGKRGRPKKVW